MSANMSFGTCSSLSQSRSVAEVFRRSVPREEYCSLLVSRRQLERYDDQARLHRGLLDLKSRELFEISDYDLFVAR